MLGSRGLESVVSHVGPPSACASASVTCGFPGPVAPSPDVLLWSARRALSVLPESHSHASLSPVKLQLLLWVAESRVCLPGKSCVFPSQVFSRSKTCDSRAGACVQSPCVWCPVGLFSALVRGGLVTAVFVLLCLLSGDLAGASSGSHGCCVIHAVVSPRESEDECSRALPDSCHSLAAAHQGLGGAAPTVSRAPLRLLV